ncbi:MAG: hypothetical protein ACLU9N_10950 [Clostridia bacterium]|mgnify:CR=1 FL=1
MLDKNTFFNNYQVENAFDNSDLSWESLEEIYDDYCFRASEITKCAKDLETYLRDHMPVEVHSLRSRKKDPSHLIEKIIRKRGIEQNIKYKGINKANYTEIIRDLIGIRILIFSKEEWCAVFDSIRKLFAKSAETEYSLAEPPVAYTRYGDRNIFGDRDIHVEHTNKGYRSQHYIVKFNGYYCEIQVRTLTEEVYGEFDHKVKYPYRNDNKFLIRYTATLSQLLGSVDELISTCFQMKPEGWEQCNRYYEKDEYIDWEHISKKSDAYQSSLVRNVPVDDMGRIDVGRYLNEIILRKE